MAIQDNDIHKIDPETGEPVDEPVSVYGVGNWTQNADGDLVPKDNETIAPPAVKTEQAAIKSNPASYHVYTDESTIWAIPQPNPAGPSLAEVQDTDIGPLLEEIIENQLPPQGNKTRANGKVLLKRGDYPGKMSNGAVDGTWAASGLTIDGEIVHQDRPNSSGGTVPTTNPPVRLRSDSNHFILPPAGGDHVIYPRVSNLQLYGGTTAFNDSVNSGTWDYLQIDNVQAQSISRPLRLQSSVNIWMNRCRWKNESVNDSILGADRTFVTKTIFINGSGSTSGGFELRGGWFHNCDFEGFQERIVRARGNVGSDNTVHIINSRLTKLGSTDAGTGIFVEGGSVDIDGLEIIREVGGTEGWFNPIRLDGGSDHYINRVSDRTPSARTVTLSSAGTTGSEISLLQPNNGVVEITDGAADENMINGVGYEEANAETPQSTVWTANDTVVLRDTGDQSGDGLFTKLPSWAAQTGTWYRHSDGAFV